MDKHDLSRIFNEIGLLLELKSENPFKTRAYYNAARTIENLTEDLAKIIEEGRVSELPGFGAALAKKVEEWSETGTIDYYENLKSTTPPGLFELLRVPGLGAKKINTIYQKLGDTSIDMLEEACNQNRLASLRDSGLDPGYLPGSNFETPGHYGGWQRRPLEKKCRPTRSFKDRNRGQPTPV